MRLCVIPSGVPVPSAAADHADGPLGLVYVGRLAQETKRILETIDALAAVLRQLPEATASLIGHCGGAPDEATIDARIAEHGLGDRLVRMGTVEPDALHEVLRRFHVLVLLSDYEGTPGSVMDGIAAGQPESGAQGSPPPAAAPALAPGLGPFASALAVGLAIAAAVDCVLDSRAFFW